MFFVLIFGFLCYNVFMDKNKKTIVLKKIKEASEQVSKNYKDMFDNFIVYTKMGTTIDLEEKIDENIEYTNKSFEVIFNLLEDIFK